MVRTHEYCRRGLPGFETYNVIPDVRLWVMFCLHASNAFMPQQVFYKKPRASILTCKLCQRFAGIHQRANMASLDLMTRSRKFGRLIALVKPRIPVPDRYTGGDRREVRRWTKFDLLYLTLRSNVPGVEWRFECRNRSCVSHAVRLIRMPSGRPP